jgi:glutamyl-tRNA reductase
VSILLFGVSHRSAPVSVLEQLSIDESDRNKIVDRILQSPLVTEAMVLSTCNRVEVYADVGKFHSAMAAICELLARHSGVPSNELTPCLYVHYEDRAVQHLLAVACGLDSMVVGESQILGQVRQALTLAREHATLDRALSELSALALRTGKRAHSETGIDRAGANLLSVGLTAAAAELEPAPDGPVPVGSAPGGSALDPAAGPVLAGRSVLVVGAGSMSALAVAGTARAGATGIVVANRTPTHAKRLADTVAGTPADLTDLAGLIAAADLVISCTGASGTVITRATVAQARSRRDRPGALVFLDLALPRDVEAGTGDLPDVAVVDLETLAASGAGGGRDADVAAVRAILGQEFEAYLSAGRAAAVAPTVVALREKAAQVVDAELARLEGRLGGLDPQVSREVARSMQRITDKLLHSPTVRVKELAGAPGGESYAAMLRTLFDLDPDAVRAVAQADAGLAGLDAEAPGAAPAAAATAEWAP